MHTLIDLINANKNGETFWQFADETRHYWARFECDRALGELIYDYLSPLYPGKVRWQLSGRFDAPVYVLDLFFFPSGQDDLTKTLRTFLTNEVQKWLP